MEYNKTDGYAWDGMRQLTDSEIEGRMPDGGLSGYYKLYPDNTEALIEDYTEEEIRKHIDLGGAIGEEVADKLPR